MTSPFYVQKSGAIADPASLNYLLLFKYTKELIKPALFQFCHSVKFSRIKPYPFTFRTLIYLYPFIINLYKFHSALGTLHIMKFFQPFLFFLCKFLVLFFLNLLLSFKLHFCKIFFLCFSWHH